MAERTIVASAPAKVILLGGKGVNWGFPALVAAVGIRTSCTVRPGPGKSYRFTYGDHTETGDASSLSDFKRRIDDYRARKSFDEITAVARQDFFAPVRHVLAHVVERTSGLGFDISWRSDIPVGSGLGSGAAASASMAAAVLRAAGKTVPPRDLAWIAWQGDVIAHGGLGTGLDSGGSTLGGIVRYSLDDGPRQVAVQGELPLVVGDTLLRASTATSNTASRNWLDEHPMRIHLLQEMGLLVEQAQEAIAKGDLARLGFVPELARHQSARAAEPVPYRILDRCADKRSRLAGIQSSRQ